MHWLFYGLGAAAGVAGLVLGLASVLGVTGATFGAPPYWVMAPYCLGLLGLALALLFAARVLQLLSHIAGQRIE